jgi:hypothetical protein
MDALKAATETAVREACRDLRAAIEGLDSDQLGRAPAPETSSLAVLVRHARTSTRALLGAAATGRINRRRYRDDERTPSFENQPANEAELREVLDGLESEATRLLAETPMDRLGEDVVLEGPEPGDPATRAWMLLHAVEHLREHVGHAQLTRQVLLNAD